VRGGDDLVGGVLEPVGEAGIELDHVEWEAAQRLEELEGRLAQLGGPDAARGGCRTEVVDHDLDAQVAQGGEPVTSPEAVREEVALRDLKRERIRARHFVVGQ
jgi:hypothetical protein